MKIPARRFLVWLSAASLLVLVLAAPAAQSVPPRDRASESECKDRDGGSPCAVIDPVGTNYDGVIGQWDDNGISATDSEKARLVYGKRTSSVAPNDKDNPLRKEVLAK